MKVNIWFLGSNRPHSFCHEAFAPDNSWEGSRFQTMSRINKGWFEHSQKSTFVLCYNILTLCAIYQQDLCHMDWYNMKAYIIAFEGIEYSAGMSCLIRCVFRKSYFIFSVVELYTQGGVVLREKLQIHVSAKENNISQHDSMIIK